MPFPTVLLSLSSVEFLSSRKAFTAVSVYVYTHEMFTKLSKRHYLGKTPQFKHGIIRLSLLIHKRTRILLKAQRFVEIWKASTKFW